MLEISLKQDDQEILFSRLPDTIESDAVVAMIKAVLDAHKAKSEDSFGQPNGNHLNSEVATNTNSKTQRKLSTEVTVTNNLKAALAAVKRLGRPIKEAREIEDLLQQDSRYSGSGMETVRYLLRQLERGGYIVKNNNSTKELTEFGLISANRFEKELLNTILNRNDIEPDEEYPDLPFKSDVTSS